MDIRSIAAVAAHKARLAFFPRRAEERIGHSDADASPELFNAERMERHAAELAASHRLRLRPKPGRLLARLAENERVLSGCCGMFSEVTALSRLERRISPAGEWLLDNYWMVEGHIHAVRRHLPETYMKDLPQLSGGASDGMPRVYDIALENIFHADGQLDGVLLGRFVEAYQMVAPLSLGELWAIPIMLRLALIENLSRVAARVRTSWHERQLAAVWGERILQGLVKGKREVFSVMADMISSEPSLEAPFVAELARRLHGQGAAAGLPLHWVEEELARSGRSIEQSVAEDIREQAAEQVSISHSMNGLRLLASMDWHDFVEQQSVVERLLRQDPAGVYPAMTFGTRDHYRHAVERLARKYELPEENVARLALAMAGRRGQEAASFPAGGRVDAETAPDLAGHVGFYLIDNGLPEFKKALSDKSGARVSSRGPGRDRRERTAMPVSLYIGGALGLALLLTWPFLTVLRHGGAGVALLAAAAAPIFIVASQLTTKLINWLACMAVSPRFMPRLDFSGGIPAGARTLVVVPAMIGSEEDIAALLEGLEAHFLANRENNVQFGLLTDFKDAPEEVLALDADLLARLETGIAALNARYSAPDADVEPFFFCHRPRRWCESERAWIAWERKRGKLAEFNALLRGRGSGRFMRVVGNAVAAKRDLAPVRYVVTLDADTRLPRDVVRQLVGSMAHPLNRPVHDPETRCVVSGYAVMQPRVASTLTSATRSAYARLFCADAGIDPYTRAVSDVYQDLFRQGSYIGKGIYAVDSFDEALGDRFPENSILSHDLIEGCYARSGLVSDVLVYEDYPSGYSADVARHSRWIRGDWQLLPWILPRVPAPAAACPSPAPDSGDPVSAPTSTDGAGGAAGSVPAGGAPASSAGAGSVPGVAGAAGRVPAGGRPPASAWEKNPLSALSRWKIADNMRRSLVPLSLLLMLLIGWFTAANPAAWTLLVLAMAFSLPLLDVFQSVLRRRQDVPIGRRAAMALHSLDEHAARMMLVLVWLPFESAYSVAAILRTLWRMAVSRRGLLQWTPSCDAALAGAKTLPAYFRLMRSAPLAAATVAALLAVFKGGQAAVWFTAGPFLALWVFAPVTAWKLSRVTPRRHFAPGPQEERFLGGLARRTWAYFDAHVGPEDNWLPPDNMQEFPELVVAHRTSPTNMGLSLLSHLAARDFGYIGAGRMLERLDGTLTTMSRLERHKGHFYNWYDTRTLEVLKPRYISSVDSGNLSGFLLTLHSGLLELADSPVLHPRCFRGVAESADILGAALPVAGNYAREWEDFQAMLAVAEKQDFSGLHEAALAMRGLASAAITLRGAVNPAGESAAGFWLDALTRQCSDLADELDLFALPPDTAAFLAACPRSEGAPGPAAVPFNRPHAEACVFGAYGESPACGEHAGHTAKVRGGSGQGGAGPDGPFLLPTWGRLAGLNTACLPVELREKAERVRALAAERVALAGRLAETAADLADADFSFLFDKSRNLLSIGWNFAAGRMDQSFYDLLASEARLAYFVAIARGQLPQKSWFSLGRLISRSEGTPVLLSWTGSMFEYLMPLLVMPSCEGTLLDEGCRGAVRRQIAYGRGLGLPWGVSESGYNVRDGNLNYQYHAFGVPGLGLKRGLGEDAVVAPYATVLALPLVPDAAVRNLRRLLDEGLGGRFGLYEAVDYTAARLPRGWKSVVIRSFMTHHQGMILLALATALLGGPMQRRFLARPEFRASSLLLEERVPEAVPEYRHDSGETMLNTLEHATRATENALRVFPGPDAAHPAVQLLSNGRYHVAVSSAGGGWSRHEDLAVTRWREDATRDNHGIFCYLRDVQSGEFWSAAHQPVAAQVERYEAVFSGSRAEFKVRNKDFDSHMDIVVSPEDDLELRRVRIANRGKTRRTIELTSYAEVALAPQMADAQHPAFAKLFVSTELHPDLRAVTCGRRPRSPEEQPVFMFHALAVHGAEAEDISYETDRCRFIGRGRSLTAPAVLDPDVAALSGSAGAVLDPIAAIRCRITLEPGKSAAADLFTGVAPDRARCLGLVSGYKDRHLADRIFDLAWTHSRVLLHQFNASIFEARLYEEMAAPLMYGGGPLRADAAFPAANTRSQAGLWGQSISGDKPIALLKVSGLSHAEFVAQMVKAHAYWRAKGLIADLVILDESHTGYRQELLDLVIGSSPAAGEIQTLDRPGGIYLRFADQISREDLILLEASARVVFSDRNGSLAEQTARTRIEGALPGPFRKQATTALERERGEEARDYRKPALLLANRYGGFTPDGSEYVITLREGETLPAPWVNVIANRNFGTVISESGSAYTWKDNAHECRLTPWMNDPVQDECGEAMYIRDEESGEYWSPTPLPRRGRGSYCARHGFGYSVFCHMEDGVRSELRVFVAREAPVRFSVLKVYNVSGRERRLSATAYVEWVLGDLRSGSAQHIVTARDAATGTLYAVNPYSRDFSGTVAFFDVNQADRRFTADRTEFIGRNGSLRSPAAMSRAALSGRGAGPGVGGGTPGRIGAGLDPCAALQTPFTLKDGESREIIFILGAADGMEQASALARRFLAPRTAQAERRLVSEYWRDMLGAVQITTPDPAMDVLANGWLMYQATACRCLARSGYYQSGGAFGFRDQLQDCMAVVHAAPELLREQILRCAARQFPEGDVQHWWHPPMGRGVRTRCSDDLLWLPVAVERYIRVTGDTAVLDASVPYLEGRPLREDEESYYDNPFSAGLSEPVYNHCVRAFEHVRHGERGLPLMGGGDWNDGMDRVGVKGMGESVWLGFFLFRALSDFIPLAEARGDAAFAARAGERLDALRESLERHGWDGAWYRRAYFDDGTPLGSEQNEECRIDSLAQSWSVLSSAAPDWRQKKAMQSLYEHLVRRESGIVRLLDPPFDRAALEPGYIKGYVPGVRENGGQYTHAAVWAAMAFAALGDTVRAWQLFRMLNPVLRGDDMTLDTYKTEPYVMAADVYAVAPHEGRGGWTWYTGAAGWMYRLILESLLGLRVESGVLRIEPLLPQDWNGFTLKYRRGKSRYHIQVRRAGHEERPGLNLDGSPRKEGNVPLLDDGALHEVLVVI